MHDSEKLEDARRALREKLPPWGTKWRHRETGDVYHLIGGVLIEATVAPAVAYSPVDGTDVWVRPLDEFLENFEEVRK